MTVITRKRSGNFALIPNEVAEDSRLSFEARGLLCYLLAKPHDWQIHVRDVMKAGAIGRDKAYRLIKELREVGYVSYDERRDPATGRVIETNYTVYDCAVPGVLPLPEKPEPVRPLTEKPEAAAPVPDLPDPEKPRPGLPDPEKPDGLIRPTSNNTQNLQGRAEFTQLTAAWGARPLPKNLLLAEKKFLSLPAQIDREKAVKEAPAYIRLCARRGEQPQLMKYLDDRSWRWLDGAPAIDRDGDFIITPDREEWGSWMDDIRARHGDVGVQTATRERRIVRPTRWPLSNVSGPHGQMTLMGAM